MRNKFKIKLIKICNYYNIIIRNKIYFKNKKIYKKILIYFLLFKRVKDNFI